jgi:hypothetical protein
MIHICWAWIGLPFVPDGGREEVMIHIVIPEGLNRFGAARQPLSDYYEACLRRVAEVAGSGETVCLAPGNTFGYAQPEDEIAADFLQQLRSDLVIHRITDERRSYLDTLDNAAWLRAWAHRNNRWPMGDCLLYCNRYHVVRTWLCFRVTGYRVQRIIACAPEKRSKSIVPRLKYYDYPAVYLVYEVLAIGYTFLHLAGNFVRTGRFLPALEKIS